MTEKPTALAVIPDNIPRRLATGKRFVLWRWELREGKWTKPPYQPNGQLASVDDPYTWSTFAVALDAYASGKFDGIGRTAEDGIVGVDQDHCVENGNIEPQARARVDLLDSYTEVSPSGTGLRTFVWGRLPDGGRRKGNLELYDSGRYLTLTGHRVDGLPAAVMDRPAQILELHRQIFGVSENGSNAALSASTSGSFSPTAYQVLDKARGHKNWALWDRLLRGDCSNYARDGNDGESEADSALCCLAAFYTRDPFVIDTIVRGSGLMREKWDRADYRERTIAHALETVKERYDWSAQDSIRHRQHIDGEDGPKADESDVAGDDERDSPTGWAATDLAPYLTGERRLPPTPTMLQRADGINLLYDRKLHWISGEPEGLKSWLAQVAVADAIMLGKVAVYVDFESDADAVINRLLALGCTTEAILGNLSYHRPEIGAGQRGANAGDLASAPLLAAAARRRPSISIIDGVQASMGLDDLDSNSARDFYRWWRSFGRSLLKLTNGPTVAVDHVVKLPENRKQYAAGTGQKQAAVDVHIGTEILEPFGVGMTGRAALTLQKDRPGMLQRHAGKRIEGRAPIAVLTMQSFGESGGIRFALEPPAGSGFRPTVYMERVSRHCEDMGERGLAQSKAAIEKAVSGKAEYIRKAVDALVAESYLQMTPGRVIAGTPTASYVSTKPYREAADPIKNQPSQTVLRIAGEVVI
jgi:putative DNA primase/helicase